MNNKPQPYTPFDESILYGIIYPIFITILIFTIILIFFEAIFLLISGLPFETYIRMTGVQTLIIIFSIGLTTMLMMIGELLSIKGEKPW